VSIGDGFVKSPSAALRFDFVIAAHLLVRLIPQSSRALHLELFTEPSLFDRTIWEQGNCG